MSSLVIPAGKTGRTYTVPVNRTPVFLSDAARRQARLARATAVASGHDKLDRFQLEAGRPVSVCSCGLYLFVQPDGRDYAWGYGRLPGTRGAIGRHDEARS